MIPASFLFFLVVLALRLAHAAWTPHYHICGDLSLPWLMANDWDWTHQNRFFWAQSYMGTYETWILARVGRLFFPGDQTIPLWMNVAFSQLLYATGATLFYQALCRIDPDYWKSRAQFLLSILLLGFAVPAFQKYTFGIGHGYSSVPLIVGLCFWVWSELIEERRRPLPLLLCGTIAGLSLHVCRLNIVPIAALGLSRLIRLRGGWRPEWKAEIRWALWFGIGGILGVAPELVHGLQSNSPNLVSLFPLNEKLTNLGEALAQSGVSLGLLPYGWLEGEHALWFRGHQDFPRLAIRILNLLSGISVLWLAFRIRKRPDSSRYSFLFWLAGINLLLIVLSHPEVDRFGARRYAYPAFFALSAWVLLERDFWLGRALISARTLGLALYLAASLSFKSPLAEIRPALARAGFDENQDCLAGFGGDISPTLAFNSFLPKVIDTGWRLNGNYSRSVSPEAYTLLHAGCRKVFYLETGGSPTSVASRICPRAEVIFRSDRDMRNASWDPMGSEKHRPPVQLLRCAPS